MREAIDARISRWVARDAVLSLDLDPSVTPEVFARYFDAMSPFSNKKKSEFPDAFAILSSRAWAIAESKALVTVSGDKDWIEFAAQENGVHFDSVENFLNKLISFGDVKCPIDTVIADKDRKIIQRDIADLIEKSSHSFSAELACVDAVSVTSVNLDDVCYYFGSEGNQRRLLVPASVEMIALVHFPNHLEIKNGRVVERAPGNYGFEPDFEICEIRAKRRVALRLTGNKGTPRLMNIEVEMRELCLIFPLLGDYLAEDLSEIWWERGFLDYDPY